MCDRSSNEKPEQRKTATCRAKQTISDSFVIYKKMINRISYLRFRLALFLRERKKMGSCVDSSAGYPILPR